MTAQAISIVCAVDFSEFAPSVIEHALSEAHHHSQVALHFITVLEPGKGLFSHTTPSASELEEADEKLRSLVMETLPTFMEDGAKAIRKVRFHARVGKPEDEIIELSYEAKADLIIVGRRGARRGRKMGSVATRVVEATPCTVYVVQLSAYDTATEDYELCAECVQVREESAGEMWFCSAHSDGRSPRLSRSIGVSTPTPGWGLF